MWIKARHVPHKGGEMPSESSHEGEVAKKGEIKGGIMVLGGDQVIIG